MDAPPQGDHPGEADADNGDFGSVAGTHRLWLFFTGQVERLRLAQAALAAKANETTAVVLPLVYSVVDSSGSIARLARDGGVRDSFVLARTVFETIVNASFILAQGQVAADRARRHAIQKAHRDLARTSQVGPQRVTLAWQGSVDLTSQQEVAAAVAEFTSRKGREITDWTPETVEQRLEAVLMRYGPGVASALQFTLIAVYRHASEIAHGTLFGALFSLGLTTPDGPPRSEGELQARRRGDLSMVLMLLGMSIGSLLEVIDHEVPVGDLVSESKRAIDGLRRERWVGAEGV